MAGRRVVWWEGTKEAEGAVGTLGDLGLVPTKGAGFRFLRSPVTMVDSVFSFFLSRFSRLKVTPLGKVL